MRDRLIELLNDCQHEYDKEVRKAIKENRKPIGENAFYADHLLAEGVIVPPCKVGDYVKVKGDSKVWWVDALHFYREGVPEISISNRKVTNTMSFETFEACMEVLTREEAEKALAKRAGES